MSHIEYIHSECNNMIYHLHNHLASKGHSSLEGHSGQILSQMADLITLTTVWPRKPHLKILEIGFNAGHSALAFLMNPTALVTSIDIGAHSYVLDAKAFIDEKNPLRHTLVIGDSKTVLFKWLRDHPDDKFDFIFIDGAHDYSTAKADLDNCLKLCHDDTLIIMDDVIMPSVDTAMYGWAMGPSQAWAEARSNNKVEQMERRDYAPGRGMAWGKKLTEAKGGP